MDLFRASLATGKPDYDLCSSYRVCLETEFPNLRQRYHEKITTTLLFPTTELEDSFQLLLWDIRCYLEMVNSYGKAGYISLQRPLALYRNVIQHRLLSIDSDASKPVREICRVALLFFSSVVVYPLQNQRPMLQYLHTLTNHLKSATHIEDDFRLWLLVLGGMAANTDPLKPWYISQLRALSVIYPRSWSSVRGLLEEFLWLESACGEGGLELWLEVMLDAAMHQRVPH